MIKSSVDAPSKKETSYPCLKRSRQTGAIVLFANQDSGTVVYQGSSLNPIGHHSNSFCGSVFETINNEVRLTNSD